MSQHNEEHNEEHVVSSQPSTGPRREDGADRPSPELGAPASSGAAGSEPPPPPRLTRSREDRMIAGVAGGLARYFGVDPVIVRIAFVLLALTGGGVLAYLIAWVVIPEATIEEEGAGRTSTASSAVAGLMLITLGAILLIDRLTPLLSWRYLGPAVLLGVGVLLLARREDRR
jgi:phage shock protein C